MRADRLLSLLMLLQSRGKTTAEVLAAELEVSVRTIYRDVEALSMAGVPVYAERGPGGGVALIDSYRTNLTGLNKDEVRALFILSIPAPLDQLGVTGELKAALRKLSAALPAANRHDEIFIRQRIHLDAVWWFQQQEAVPYLQTLQKAVWEDRKLWLKYRSRFDTEVERLVDPYGLVAKSGIWYVVCARDDLMRVYRVSRIQDVQLTDAHFQRPGNFDLATFWREWCTRFEESRPTYPVIARVAPGLVPHLPSIFGAALRETIAQTTPDAEGWLTLELPFETLEAARERILGFGNAIEIVEPEALRCSVLDFAEQIVTLYTKIGNA